MNLHYAANLDGLFHVQGFKDLIQRHNQSFTQFSMDISTSKAILISEDIQESMRSVDKVNEQ